MKGTLLLGALFAITLDVFSIDPNEIGSVRVETTIVEGRVVFERS